MYNKKLSYSIGRLQTLHTIIWDLKSMAKEEILGLVNKVNTTSKGVGLITSTRDRSDIKNIRINETFIYIDVR